MFGAPPEHFFNLVGPVALFRLSSKQILGSYQGLVSACACSAAIVAALPRESAALVAAEAALLAAA